ncbi:hypothetical protein JW314_21805 [Enterobacter roggenkampii]|uniref:hypothetical protein n=1 Tax=Enterobacter cloacae complex TaxID=354276 RepID=UPI0003BF9718|nr:MULTISPECIES: hypothetical protein [Enterobacter cloacae complex]EHF4970027.1 hypothetical protein [Enterobacter hormaechei]ESN46991.1 hypothetical protein L362_04527 [Enterobacter sp. MGH 16]MBW4222586.1 hypothetical protein [Enterobacter roggenkampii]
MSVRKAKAQRGGPDRKANDVNRRLRMTVNWLYSICWVLGWVGFIALIIKGVREEYAFRILGAFLFATILIRIRPPVWPDDTAEPLPGPTDDDKRECK